MPPDRTKTVFFSWQSDIRAAAGRTLIEDALRAAIARGGDAQPAFEAVVDRDVAGAAGAPNIAATILDKIERADVFVADVTITARTAARAHPNPNVLFELGYAVAWLGWERVILVMNTIGGPVEDLPFDLRGHLTLAFDSPEENAPEGQRAAAKRALADRLAPVVAQVLAGAPPQGKRRAAREEADRSADAEALSHLASVINGPWMAEFTRLIIELPRYVSSKDRRRLQEYVDVAKRPENTLRSKPLPELHAAVLEAIDQFDRTMDEHMSYVLKQDRFLINAKVESWERHMEDLHERTLADMDALASAAKALRDAWALFASEAVRISSALRGAPPE